MKVGRIIKIVIVSLIGLAILACIITLIVFKSLYTEDPPSKYTLEEHIDRISSCVDKKYMGEDSPYTSYSIYPLYNENDELTHFVIEFEPYGFVWVELHTETYLKNHYRYIGMYWIDEHYLSNSWQRHRISLDGTAPEEYEGHNWTHENVENADSLNDYRYFETDENGEYVKNNISPYKLAGVENTKLYWLKTYLGGIPAIKDGEFYINLISMEKFHKDEYKGQEYYEENHGENAKKIAHLDISFFKTETL